MMNKATIDGNQNIVIQDANKSSITIHTNDPDEIIEKVRVLNQEQLDALKKLLEEQSLPQYIDQVLRKLIPNTPFPKELTVLIRIPKDEIIGREKDLTNLRKRLLEDKKLSLINGMGGIGKTTLAAVYVAEYYDEYDHIAWLTIETSLEEAILANRDLLINLKLAETPSQELLGACLNQLRILNSAQPGLLVLDNATERLGKLYDALPKAPHWHVLVTSREKIEPFSVMELGFLTEEEAVLLFQKYNDQFTEEEVKDIVHEVEFHTLTIEILAKSAKKNRWGIDTVRNAIIENAKAGISTIHSGYEKIDRIKAYLIQIFKLSNVGEHQKYVLKQFTALPNQWISYELLVKLLQVEKLVWKEEFSGTLEELYEKGYIQKNESTDSYKMHPILAEALSPQFEPTKDNLRLLIESVSHILPIDLKDNPIDKFPFIPFGEAVLQRLINDTSSSIATLQNNLASVYKESGEYNKAKELLKKALTSDIAHYGENHTIVTLKLSNLATVYKNLGEYEKAKDLLEKVMVSDIAHYGRKHVAVARNQAILATVYKDLGEYEKARDLLEEALASDIAHYGENHPEVATNQSSLAMVYHTLGEYEKARDLLEKALASDIAHYDKNHPEVAKKQSNLAIMYKEMGKYEKAQDLLEKALESIKNNYDKKHPFVAISQSRLATVYYDLGEYEKARDLLEEALASDIAHYGANHPYVATNQSTLGLIYIEMGEYEKARDLLGKALESTKTNYGANHPAVVEYQTNLGLVYKKSGKYIKAKELLEKALASGIAYFGENHPTVAKQQSTLATVYYALGEYEKTRDLFKQAYETFFHTLGENHPNTKAVKSTLNQLEGK